MQRYECVPWDIRRADMKQNPEGEWARFDDVQAKIARLTAERDAAIKVLSEAATAPPIDPDAQKALDQLLAKVREDSFREAAAEDYCTDTPDLAGRGRSVGIKGRILALLNEGVPPL